MCSIGGHSTRALPGDRRRFLDVVVGSFPECGWVEIVGQTYRGARQKSPKASGGFNSDVVTQEPEGYNHYSVISKKQYLKLFTKICV